MRIALLPVVLMSPLLAVASPRAFDARVADAEAAVRSPGGFAYDTALVPAIHAAVLPCVPQGGDPASGGGFVLVADVDANGRLDAVDVKPASAIARCFARSFVAMRLRPPPARTRRPWPIVIRMQTHR